MTHVLRCCDLVPGCDYVVRAETLDEIIYRAVVHARTIHEIDPTPELIDLVLKAVHQAALEMKAREPVSAT